MAAGDGAVTYRVVWRLEPPQTRCTALQAGERQFVLNGHPSA